MEKKSHDSVPVRTVNKGEKIGSVEYRETVSCERCRRAMSGVLHDVTHVGVANANCEC